MADFFSQTERLARLVGDGHLEGVFAVDGGARTVPLEIGAWKNFMGEYGPKKIEHYNPPGGPHAVQNALEETHETSLVDIAQTVLETGPQEAMVRHVERVDEKFKETAPIRDGTYRDSAARFVIDDGTPVHESYDEHYGDDPGE